MRIRRTNIEWGRKRGVAALFLSALLTLLIVGCEDPVVPLVPNLDPGPTTGKAPFELALDASSSEGAGLSFSFTPGDGSGAVTRPSGVYRHVYTEPGQYTATVTISDAQGETAQESVTVTVEDRVTPPNLEKGTWTQFSPEGTVCSDGSPYSFFATPGASNNLVIDFQGGGACWNDFSCSRGITGTYARNIYLSPEQFTTGDINGDGIRDAGGIYDRSRADNPVANWSHVYVSYCTGDVHWGNTEVEYTEINGPDAGQPNLIQHRGAVNAQATLDWVYDNFEAPDTIFVTGCSAGAYGAAMWTPHIARQYPNANIRVMADCGAGIVNDSFLREGITQWNVFEGAWPSFIPALDVSEEELTTDFISTIYTEVGKAYPNASLSQFNTMGDGGQIFYYALMEDDYADTNNDGIQEVVPTDETIESWLERMPQTMDTIEANTPNFHSYLSMFDDNGDLTDGTGHCAIFRPEFYEINDENVSLVNWLDDLINGRTVISVRPEDVPDYESIKPFRP